MRLIAYLMCILAIGWLGFGSLRFRQELRTSLKEAYARAAEPGPGLSGDSGKVLNSYYEDLYRNLPETFIPMALLFAGATALFVIKRKEAPNPLPEPRPLKRHD